MRVTIYDLKPAFQGLLRPLCRQIARLGVTANQVTVLTVILSVVVGLSFAWAGGTGVAALLVPAWLFVRMALNAIDGMLAREHGMQSALGGMLNELGDVVSDAALYLPFALVPGVSATLVVGVVLLAMLTEMSGVVAVQIGAERRYDGPMGKSDRAFAFGLAALLLGVGVAPGVWLDVGLALIMLLSIATVLRRSAAALKNADSAATEGQRDA